MRYSEHFRQRLGEPPERANPIQGLAEIKNRLQTRLQSTDWEVPAEEDKRLAGYRYSSQTAVEPLTVADPALQDMASSVRREPQVVVWCGTRDEVFLRQLDTVQREKCDAVVAHLGQFDYDVSIHWILS